MKKIVNNIKGKYFLKKEKFSKKNSFKIILLLGLVIISFEKKLELIPKNKSLKKIPDNILNNNNKNKGK